MITSYALHGDFIESCDCFDLCPCWVDDDPDEDHCTGLVVWKLGTGSTIGTDHGGEDVSGAVVAAVTGHSGGRRTASALTVLYVDVGTCADESFHLLASAFAGTDGGAAGMRVAGALGALATVTGTLLRPAQAADIAFPAHAATWKLTVTPRTKGSVPSTEAAVSARGEPRTFPDDPANPDTGSRTQLELLGTALHAELQIQKTAKAQHTTELSIRVPALPGGYLEVRGRSGMRGTFSYSHSNGTPKKQSGRGRKNGRQPAQA